jgi:hypothetical protein
MHTHIQSAQQDSEPVRVLQARLVLDKERPDPVTGKVTRYLFVCMFTYPYVYASDKPRLE